MQKPYFLFFIILLVLGIVAGCKPDKAKEPVVSEGIVNYRISYSPEIEKRSFSFLLPDKMDYYFRPGQERISFIGNMGLYRLDFISNHQNDSSITLLKILNNKMYVPSSESKELFIFKNLRHNEVFFHEDTTREILNYEVHKASIHLYSGNIDTNIDIWYTPQISTSTTNKNTPFAEIPGVMLEFAIYYNDVLFNLKPQNIEKTVHPDSIFDIPDDYRATTIKEIEEMVLDIIN